METTINNLNLLPHNLIAYRKVTDYFDAGNNKAAIVHATGTGKSYIIAAVTQHFGNVVIVAPNNFVLNETRKICGSNVTFKTYASVMCDESPAEHYDLIVLDEFHRAGAEKWGLGVQRLISANPNAKIFGTSATAIRYLDKERNMADEIFDGNVVSHIPLKEALDRKLVPTPIYVASLYSIDKDIKSRKAALEKNKYKTDEEKLELTRRLDGIAHNWENAHGVSVILKKYLRKDTKRIIVFCSKIRYIEKIKRLLGAWLSLAGFGTVHFYNIDYMAETLKRNMKEFQDDDFDGLKVALSVNMLNEGVHVPRVDSVIMLRSTVSRIIIEQQAGRCLTTDNKEITPVIFDLVNNMDLIRYADGTGFGNGSAIEIDGTEVDMGKGLPFEVRDECRDMRTFFSQMDKSLSNDDIWYNVYLPMNEKFYNENGHLPTPKEHQRLYLFNREQRNKPLQKRYPHRIKWLSEHGFNVEFKEIKSIDERLDMLTDGLARYGSVTVMRNNDTKLLNMWDNMKYAYYHGKRNRNFDFNTEQRNRFADLLEKYCPDKWEMRFLEIKKVLEDVGESGLARNQRDWITRYLRKGGNPEKINRLKELGVCDFIKKVSSSHDEELTEFIRTNGRLPVPSEKALYGTAMRFKRESAQKSNPALFKLLLEYGFNAERKFKRNKESIDERCHRIKKTCIEEGKFIGSLNTSDYDWYQNISKAEPDNPAVIDMRETVEKLKNTMMSAVSTANLYEERVARIRKIGEKGYIIDARSILNRWWRSYLRNERLRKNPDQSKINELESLGIYMSKATDKNGPKPRWSDD